MVYFRALSGSGRYGVAFCFKIENLCHAPSISYLTHTSAGCELEYSITRALRIFSGLLESSLMVYLKN